MLQPDDQMQGQMARKPVQPKQQGLMGQAPPRTPKWGAAPQHRQGMMQPQDQPDQQPAPQPGAVSGRDAVNYGEQPSASNAEMTQQPMANAYGRPVDQPSQWQEQNSRELPQQGAADMQRRLLAYDQPWQGVANFRKPTY